MKSHILSLLVFAVGLIPIVGLSAEGLEPPVPVRTVSPVFPSDMRRDGISGIVMVSILIDEKGNVQEPKVEKTSNDAFSAPALDALKKWKFKPAKKAGEPVALRVSIPIKFNVGDS